MTFRSSGVTTRVKLDRSLPGETVFRYEVQVDGELTLEQRHKLSLAANACPVRRTLSQKIRLSLVSRNRRETEYIAVERKPSFRHGRIRISKPMEKFQIWAQPWWVNFLLFVPVLSYLVWRRRGLAFYWQQLLTLALFGAAFGFVEAAVVVYLRTAAGVFGQYTADNSQLRSPAIYQQAMSSLAQFPQSLRTIEIFREAATMIMLVTIALLAAAKAKERWAAFLWVFAAWDITYYLGLWATLRWPTSLKDYDVLFLIPVPWVAQVWFPVLVSALALAAVVFSTEKKI